MTEAIKDDLVNRIMVGSVIGLLAWNIFTTQKLTVDVAVLTEKIIQLERALK